MKALVLEAKNGMSAVLLDDGSVRSVAGEFTPGRTVELREVRQSTGAARAAKSRRARRFAAARTVAAAAAAAVVVVSGAGTLYCETAYACSYVSLDVNPSIEFSLNRQDRVLGVKPMNDDAAVIVDRLIDIDVKGDTISEAIEKTKSAVKDMKFDDYTAPDTYLVDISSDSVARMEKLSKEIEESFKSDSRDDSTLVLVTSSVEERYTAQSLGISTGRYAALRQVKDIFMEQSAEISDADVDEYKTKAVKEIVGASEGVSVPADTVSDQAAAAASTAASVEEVKPEPTPEPEPVADTAPQTVEAQPAAQPEQPKQAEAPKKKKKKKAEKPAEETPTDETASATEATSEEENTEDDAAQAATADESGVSSTEIEGEDSGWAAEDDSQSAATATTDQSGEASSAEQSADTAASDAGTTSADNATDDATAGSGSTSEALQATEGATSDTASTGATDNGGGSG